MMKSNIQRNGFMQILLQRSHVCQPHEADYPSAVTRAVWINSWSYCRAQWGLQNPGLQENRFVHGALFMIGIQPSIPSKRWFCTNENPRSWQRKLQFTSIGWILFPGRNWFKVLWIVVFPCPLFGFLLEQLTLLAGGWRRANSKYRQGLRWGTRSPGKEVQNTFP